MEKSKVDKIKKIVEIVKNVIVWALVAISVFMMIFTVVSVSFFNNNSRKIFGFRVYTVLSDSMSATDFSAGDIIFVKVRKSYTDLQPGDIISYISLHNDSYGETITHKIRRAEYTDDDELIGYVTYGTTTDKDDELVVTPDLIQGVYVGNVPKVGYFFQFIRSTVGYIICILIPFSLLIMWQGITCVRLFRRYKAEQMEEIKAEKDQIAKERDELQSMMAELMQLKSQLAQNPSGAQSEAVGGTADSPAASASADISDSTSTSADNEAEAESDSVADAQPENTDTLDSDATEKESDVQAADEDAKDN